MLKSARKQEKNDEGRMPLLDHLRELRNRLLKAVLAIVVVMIVAAFYQKEIYEFLLAPIQESVGCKNGVVTTVDGKSCALLKTDTLIGPFTNALKVALMSGVLLATPVWLYQLWAFVAPGLHKNEKRYAYAFAVVGAPLFLSGGYLAYAILPQTAEIMLGFSPDDVQNQIGLDSYLDLLVRMVIVFGLAFELPLLLIALNMTGVISGKRMLGWWRGMIVGLTAFAAIATPGGEPISMLLLAGPLAVLYFIAVGFSLLNDKRRNRANPDAELADDEASQLDLTPEPVGRVENVSSSRPALPGQASGEADGPGSHRLNGYDDIT
ncbi:MULTISPECIES: twin-arginine translocase subunit TatC [Streptomyces]|uniref:twin-arginine translocase subunit TatC n=1 Tax=Streptomyces TaxID=1883 RepID=UPI0015C44CC7|nr:MULTISPECIES: twin-arginine translocase subunit TatC [Streptomyces]MCF3168098.1 twin-arginine translocase subunit TatC [Streptomyces violaceoruber]MDW4898896.1 twin-arginine translocase subunit TatC [Streptomyces californicus]QLG35946.1 twin-arginine translocase subunit TatC [Streptomyces sp. CB04723]